MWLRSGFEKKQPTTMTSAEQMKIDAAPATGSTLQMSADLVPKFNGQDKSYPASRWIQEIEDNALIFEWTPMQQLLVARRALVGTAALWLKSERPFKTWGELKAELLEEFADTTDSKTIHEMMSARKKRKDETCGDYLLVMKEMGKRGKMADYVAIKYIVDGIVDSELHKMMLYGVKTYPELKEKLKIYETIKEKVEKVKRDVIVKQDKSSYSRKISRCYNCGEPDHLSSECPNKTQGRKCFKCNNFGHVASDCKAGKHDEKVVSSSKYKSFTQVQGSKPKETYFSSSGSPLEVDGSTVQVLESSKCHDVGTTGSVTNDNGGRRGEMSICQSQDLNNNNTLSCKQTHKISEKPLKTVKLCDNFLITALIDSGSDINLMSKQCYDILGSPTCDTNNKVMMSGLGSAKVFSTGYYKTNIEIDDYRYLDVGFHIVPETCMPFKLIIGQEFLKNVLCVLNGSSVWMRPIDENWLGRLDCFPCVSDSIGYIGSEQLKNQVVTLIENYHPNQTKDIPIQLKLVLKDDVPVAQRPRRISFVEQEEVDKQVAEWLKQGIVRVSYSEYASPLVLVRKKDGTTRICVDYRRLNEKIVKDEFPLPLIEDYIDKLAGAKVFSVLDLKNGFLQDFDFIVEHREGSSMRHADALSRNPYVAVINELFDSIRKAQQADECLKAITRILQNAPYEDYLLDNGLVYKGADKKLVVPRSMEDEIINRVHQNGHFSKKKMLELLDKDYFIKNVSKKVEDFLLTCIPCLLASRKEGKQEGFLHVIDKEAIPLHTLHVDHIGPMLDTKKQYNHILTVVDGFTKFVWIFPTKSTTSKETIEKLKIHQQHFGNPTRFITDRGTAYTSNEFQEFCKDENIQHIKITTGMPRGNGQVERIHRTIISVLTKMCIESPALWYRHVSRLQRSLNSTFQRSINTTPYQLLIGTKMRMKEDIEIYNLLLEEERENYSEERDKLREKAKEQILQVQQVQGREKKVLNIIKEIK